MSKRLSDVRHALLELHKALVETEREAYEKENGPLRSPHQFLQLLTSDPRFEWLRELSQIIVMIDEAEDAKEAPADEDIQEMFKSARLLLTASVETEFGRQYREALQGNPDVVLAHAQALNFLREG